MREALKQTEFTKSESSNQNPIQPVKQKLFFKVNDRLILDFGEVSEITSVGWNDLGYLVDNSLLECITINREEYFYKDYILDWVKERDIKHQQLLTSKKEVSIG